MLLHSNVESIIDSNVDLLIAEKYAFGLHGV